VDKLFKQVGLPEFVIIPAGKTLANQVQTWREKELSRHFDGTQYVYVFIFLTCFIMPAASGTNKLAGHQFI
jgi:hypothetical protein